MSMDDEAPKKSNPAKGQVGSPAHPSATFGNQAPSLALQLNTNSVHVNVSNLTALGRLAESNPEIALKIVESSGNAVRFETRKYMSAVIVTGSVCLAIIGCSTAIIITSGFWAGIAFFLAVAAVCAIITAVYTGKGQDLSWTANIIGRAPKIDKETP